MEQKKTLWIVAAAGIFLLVVFGAALIIYSKPFSQSPAMQAGYDPYSGWNISSNQSATPVPDSSLSFTSEATASSNQSGDQALNPSPFTNSENSQAVSQNGTEQDKFHTDKITVVADNATVYSNETTTIDLNSLKSSSSSGLVAKNEMTANQINTNRVPEPKASYEQPSYSTQENYYAPAPVVQSAPKATAKSTAPKASTTKKTTSVAKAPSKSTTAAKVASAAKKTPDTFWVQAAAYTSKRNADEARTTLESNKIPSEVFTFTDAKGKTFYRVRVGPYVTKSEAEYWQTRIGMIDKFASAKSVIVNTAIN